MAPNTAQETRLLAERAKNSAQDRKHPFLINTKDGRLLPNVMKLRAHKKAGLQVYDGDPKATLAERMKYLASRYGEVSVTQAGGDEAFDIGQATKDELVVFAANEYSLTLSPTADVRTLRKQLADHVRSQSLS